MFTTTSLFYNTRRTLLLPESSLATLRTFRQQQSPSSATKSFFTTVHPSVSLRWRHSHSSLPPSCPSTAAPKREGFCFMEAHSGMFIQENCLGPRGYKKNPPPLLLGPSHCPHCLCSPCIINQAPDFLAGSASPHPANDSKRHHLYRLFWKTLKDLGVWGTEQYLNRKEQQTRRFDKRELIPDCIVNVRTYYIILYIYKLHTEF